MNPLQLFAIRQARRILAKWNIKDVPRDSRSRRSVNSETLQAADIIRQTIRHMEQNSDIVQGALHIIETAVVGENGIHPEPMVLMSDGKPAHDLNRELSMLWDEWAIRPDVTGRYNLGEAQRLNFRAWLRDGDAFRRHHINRMFSTRMGESLVPYRLELINPELVPEALIDSTKRIIGGIELDMWNRPIAIHVLKRHENFVHQAQGSTSSGSHGWDTVRVSAMEMSWLAWAHREEQVRGVSAFAPIRKRIQDIDSLDEAERRAAVLNADVALFVEREVGGGSTRNPMDAKNDGDLENKRFADFEPGLVFDGLDVGEKITSPIPHRPNENVMTFRDAQLCCVAVALGLSSSSLKRRYDHTYSAARQELVETSTAMRQYWTRWVDGMERPTWRKWIEAVRLRNLVTIPAGVNMRSLYMPVYTPPTMPWIDPQKEAMAAKILTDSHIESREHYQRQRGRDPDVVRLQVEREKEWMDETGLMMPDEGMPGENREPPED